MLLRTSINSLLRRLEKEYVTHNRIEVSQAAILHNFDLFAELTGQQIIPVLKGNAYGHGIAPVAKALMRRNMPYIAVDGYFEALRIREVSRQPVLIMGSILPANYSRLTYDDFAFVVHDADAIEALGNTGKRVKVHLEVNTGMNRYGVPIDQVEILARLILRYRNLELEGVMSHLADSDGNNPATVDAAVSKFDECVEVVRATGATPTVLHVAQSAGSVKAHSKYVTAMRLGIGLYGLNPFPGGHPSHDQLRDIRPALRLVSTITKVIDLRKGDKVSYNYTFTAPEDMTIGVLPLGYYEGVNRQLSNRGSVKLNNSDAPIVGRVCMNHTMIDLRGIPLAKVGDEVTVYSSNPADSNSIDAIAQAYGLFNYSLLTSLSHDVRRLLVD